MKRIVVVLICFAAFACNNAAETEPNHIDNTDNDDTSAKISPQSKDSGFPLKSDSSEKLNNRK